MISKSVIVFWSVTCLTIFVHLIGKDEAGTALYILFTGLLWAIVVVPAALIGQLFKSQKVHSMKMRVLRGGVLTAIGVLTFVIVNTSQQPKQRYTTDQVNKDMVRQVIEACDRLPIGHRNRPHDAVCRASR